MKISIGNATYSSINKSLGGGSVFTNTKSLQFDGVDEEVNTSASVSGTDFTLSYWVNANGSYAGFQRFHPVSIRPSNNSVNQSIGYLYTRSPQLYPSLQAYDSVGGGFSTWSARDLDFIGAGWHNIIWTFNNTTKAIYCYVDGNAQTFTNFGATATTPFLTLSGFTYSDINVGASWLPSEFWNGLVDEVSIYNSILTSEQITAISTTPIDLSSYSPIVWYRMGDNSTYQTPQILMPENTNKNKVSNYSLICDGVDDYITMGDVLNFDYNEPFTISAWIDLETSVASFMPVVAKQESSGNYRGYHFYITKSGGSYYLKFSFNNTLSNTIVVEGTTDLIGLGWVNIVATYDGSTNASGLKFYINGSLETSSILDDTLGSNTTVSTAPLNIGRRDLTTIYYKGKVDEVSIYSSELNATQVNDIWNGGEPTTITGATAYWKLGEQATFSTNWTVPDQVGSNDGTSTNMTIEDRIGDAPNSENNAVSYNMEAIDIDNNVPT